MTTGTGSPGSRRLLRLSAGAVLLFLVATPLFVRRIPDDSLAFTPNGVLGPGWRFKAPLSPCAVVRRSGRLDPVDFERTTPEGTTLRVRIDLGYQIDPAAVSGQASAVAVNGLAGHVDGILRAALLTMPLETLLRPPGTGAPITTAAGPTALPPQARAVLERAFEGTGIVPVELRGRIGPRDSFVPVGQESASGGLMPDRDPTGLRVVLIGLDGADWDTLDPLLRQGRLPRLARLLERGVRAPLRSYDPMISPLLWTTMATGVGPDEHGVADFQAVDSKTGRRVPISSRFRRVKALWNILGDAGLTSAFVGWWASYPAEAVQGYQVSNLVAFETLRPPPPGRPTAAALTWPRDYLDTIRPRLRTVADLRYEEVRPMLRVSQAEFDAARDEVLRPPEPPAGAPGPGRQAVQNPLPLALSILTGSRNYAAIATDLAARHPDLLAVYFEAIDMMGHRFQHCMPPRMPICSEEEGARYDNAVIGFHVEQDRLLGDILDAAGADATVMVVSDHGFRSGAGRPAGVLPYTTQQPVEWHDPEGIFILSGPGAHAGGRISGRPTLFDIAPTLLHLLGLPQASTMPGRVLVSALEPAFVAGHPPRTIGTYETLGAPLRATVSEPDEAARRAEDDLLAGLRALGYIGDDSPATSVPTGPGGGTAPEGGDADTSAGTGADTQVFYHRNLATYFLKRRDYARAAEQLRLANDRQKLAKNYQMLSEACLGMGRPEEALAVLREALETLPTSDAEPVLWMVLMRIGRKDRLPEVEAEARRYAARTAARPGLDGAIAGALLEAHGDLSAALREYRQSFAADPLRVHVAQRLYALEPPAGRRRSLMPAIEKALRLDPRLDEYHNLLGALLSEAGRDRDALSEFRLASGLDPDNARFSANLGGACARLGLWNEAAEAYERSASAAPSAATSLKLGSVYRRLKRPAEALAAFTNARDLGDQTSAPILGMALAQSEMNRLSEAVTLVNSGLERFPGDASLNSLRSELMTRIGRQSAASLAPPR